MVFACFPTMGEVGFVPRRRIDEDDWSKFPEIWVILLWLLCDPFLPGDNGSRFEWWGRDLAAVRLL